MMPAVGIKQFPGHSQGSVPVDPAMVLARLSAALGLMQEQVPLLKEMRVNRPSMATRARVAQLGTELRQYSEEMEAIHAYCASVFHDVSRLTQDEVQAIARHAGWLS